jgi:hypothetical protein
MSSLGVMLTSGEVVSTCPAAVGFSFAAGTTDGPGAFDFTQGDNKGNLFWRIVGGALRVPSQEQVNCQQPKPVLIDTGEMFTPYAWAVGIVTHSWECWNVEGLQNKFCFGSFVSPCNCDVLLLSLKMSL